MIILMGGIPAGMHVGNRMKINDMVIMAVRIRFFGMTKVQMQREQQLDKQCHCQQAANELVSCHWFTRSVHRETLNHHCRRCPAEKGR